MPSRPPLEQARGWWKEPTDGERVVVSLSAAVARVLRGKALVLEVAGRRAWIQTSGRARRRAGDIPSGAVFARVLDRYTSGVRGDPPVAGDFSTPDELPTYHAANQREYALTL